MTAIVDKGYHVTPEQIEHMAREVGRGQLAGVTYLRCLIVAATESRKRKPLGAINAVHEVFYAAVLRGVGDDQRAATFARSAASTLRGYVRAGGKLADIDVSTATKVSLRAFGKPAEPADRTTRSAARALDMLLRAVRRMARKDASGARRLMSEAVDAVKHALPSRAARSPGNVENVPAVH